MQTLSRLSLHQPGRVRVVAAWLAIAATLGSLPGPALASTSGASCAQRFALGAGACRGCQHAAPASASCSLTRKPCCRCEIASDPLPATPRSALLLERPVPQGHGVDAFPGAAGFAARAPLTVPRLSALGAPGPRPDSPNSPTILRL